MTPPHTDSQDILCFFKRTEVQTLQFRQFSYRSCPGSTGPRRAGHRAGQGCVPVRAPSPRQRPVAADRGCPRSPRGPSGPPVGLCRDAARHRLDAPVRCSPPRPAGNRAVVLGPGRPAGAHLWYCAWRNWNSSLMRSSDSGMVNLKGWPAAWCGVWRGGGTRERCTFRHCAAAPRGKGGGAAHRGRAGGMERAPSPVCPRPGALRTCYPPSRPSSAVGPRLTALRLRPTRSCRRRLHESEACRLLPTDPHRGGTDCPIPGAVLCGCCLARRRPPAVLPKASKLPTQQKVEEAAPAGRMNPLHPAGSELEGAFLSLPPAPAEQARWRCAPDRPALAPHPGPAAQAVLTGCRLWGNMAPAAADLPHSRLSRRDSPPCPGFTPDAPRG